MFKNRSHRATTSIVVLTLFSWMACGGTAWATARSVERDPAKVLRKLIDHPLLALSPEEKGYLRQAARRLEAEPVKPPVLRLAAPEKADPAGDLRELGTALAELAETPRAEAVSGLRLRLAAVHEQILQDFARTEALLRKAGSPKVILERHAAARAEYLTEMETVLQNLDAKSREGIAAAARSLSRSSKERPEQDLDPARLPFRAAEPVSRRPAEPSAKAGAVAEKAVAPPGPADLAASEDAQITPEVQDLAESLGRQPLKIYEWVRNNIEYAPTWGSVQDSEMTLVARRGNAFDTASLLIALLRASGVPARYVMGTVDVPADAVMNWVGGAETVELAQRFLAQGGVPNVGLTLGGPVTAVRMDHVWVEAFIDYVPSRGAVHREGDTWVPMDPSFKLHTFAPRSSLFTENPIDVVFQPGDHLFDVDEALGRISNVDTEILDERVGEWVARTDEYVLTHGGLAEVPGYVGGQSIVPVTNEVFAGSLPYRLVTRGAAVSALPAGVRHSVTLKGFASASARSLGTPAFSVTLSLLALNSGRLSLQFLPATQADADTLEAVRNEGAAALPLYLIDVVPVIALDGVEKARGTAVRMGSSYWVDVVLHGPEDSVTVPFQVVAGDEVVASVTGNGVSRPVIVKRFSEHAVDSASEYLHQIALNYWMESDFLGEIAARANGVLMSRLPSVGLFSSPLSVTYVFGAPRSGVYQGRAMDVRLSALAAAGEEPARVVSFMKQAGIQSSYLEGAVFDQFKDPSDPVPRGISSIHLISAAMNQGIPIYRVTAANAASVLPLLAVSPAIKTNIAASVSQGKTVLVPESSVDLGPWAGTGYIIQDETTGAGAYLISGGLAGGGLLDCLPELEPNWEVILQVTLILALIGLMIGAIALPPVGLTAAATLAFLVLMIAALRNVNTAAPVTA